MRTIFQKSHLVLFVFLLLFQVQGRAERTIVSPSDTAKTLVHHSLMGNIELDYNYFYKKPFFNEQINAQNSIAINTEYKVKHKNLHFVFHPFIRYDIIDSYRSHADIRELFVSFSKKKTSLNAGIRRYSWTNFIGYSIVNFANRVDIKENPLSVEKLGQLGFDFNYQLNDKIKIAFILMPYSREMNYPDFKTRLLYTPILISNDNVTYESKHGRSYPEMAIRSNVNLGKTEFTFGIFRGYNRTTALIPNSSYTMLNQNNQLTNLGSIEVQQVLKGLIFRSEAMVFSLSDGHISWGIHPGIEYSFSSLLGSRAELLVSFEYIYDEQKKTNNIPFGNNYLGNFRLDFGDINSTAIQMKLISNASHYDSFIDLEISRRFWGKFKAKINSNFTIGKIDKTNPLYVYQHSTLLGGKLAWYF